MAAEGDFVFDQKNVRLTGASHLQEREPQTTQGSIATSLYDISGDGVLRAAGYDLTKVRFVLRFAYRGRGTLLNLDQVLDRV